MPSVPLRSGTSGCGRSPHRGDTSAINAPQLDAEGHAQIQTSLPHLSAWPTVSSRIATDPAVESRVQALLSELTLEQKVGQMTQPEINACTPDDVRNYHIGSVLNGGGSWPADDKHSSPAEWLALADAYWDAALAAEAQTPLPVFWGIDAVHGHSNVFGATLFPHNIGLGAARNPALIREIGRATAAQMRVTGQDWAFAPTLAVVKDDRWGRTYEGFSEDPRIVAAYGYEAVLGLQGEAADGIGPEGVVATAKHYLGDGGTRNGKDQGINESTEDEMRNVHAQGYYTAIAAGAQTVMASFNSWDSADGAHAEGKIHGSHYAMTEILKNRLGFDGLIVGDWNGHGQVEGCTNAHAPRAINAGLDVIMVPHDWKEFISETIELVKSGEIPMARIDDAVSRILRVKIRLGLFDAKKPSERLFAGDSDALQWRDLGRRAVRESLVLLKNNGNVLPLQAGTKVLVVGKSADSMSNQTGGWSLTWQGTDNTNDDYPNGTTILAALRQALGADNVTFAEAGEGVDVSAYDAVVAVIGETPYAEGVGDIGRRTLEAATLFPEDLAVLDAVNGKGTPVVTVMLTGRPLYANAELNRSDAFVVAWLPGSEGDGVADVLVQGAHTGAGFTGTLSFSWPRTAMPTPVNVGDADYDPLFPYGYGLTYESTELLPTLDESSIDPANVGGEAGPTELTFFDRTDLAPYVTMIASGDAPPEAIGNDLNRVIATPQVEVRTADVNVQLDARRITWTGQATFLVRHGMGGVDASPYLGEASAIVFDTVVTVAPTETVTVGARAGNRAVTFDATQLFASLAGNGRSTVKIALSAFEIAGGFDPTRVDVPLFVSTSGNLQAAFANLRWVPGAGDDADAVTH